MTKKILQGLIASLLILIVILGALWFFQHRKLYPSTDDAYVQGHTINIATQVSGIVQTVNIHNHQHVTQGQTLFTIDPKPFQIALNQAKAQLKTTSKRLKPWQHKSKPVKP